MNVSEHIHFKTVQNYQQNSEFDNILKIVSELKVFTGSNKEKFDKFKVEILEKIANVNKTIEILTNRIKKIEKKVDINELAGIINKHYEQSRRSKRNL